ncbi:MAG: leucine-rich repeat domain-containing protein [Eubacteriaceae bacterium]|nr:leucine-rich repeat domain-containing protein [Eubacteriaceae bacterium]
MKKKILLLVVIAGIILFPLSAFSAEGPERALYDPSYSLFDSDAAELEKWYSKVVEVPDASLRAALRDNLGISDGGVITVFDMLYHLPTTLDISHLDIKDLKGLEYAINLEKLYAGNNLISMDVQIEPIKDLYKLEVLDLSRNDLTNVPSFIFELDGLKSLNLSDNEITSIESFGEKSSLEELYMENNLLKSLPDMTPLGALQTLSVSKNELESFPEGISVLSSLTSLAVANNNLTVLPDLSGFTGLTVINLEGNELTSFPAGIGSMKDLVQIDLSNNKIKSIPQEVFSLEKLSAMFLSFNELEKIPHELADMPSLAVLDISMNHIDKNADSDIILTLTEHMGEEAFMHKMQYDELALTIALDGESQKPAITFGGIENITALEGTRTVEEVLITKKCGASTTYHTLTSADLEKMIFIDYEADMKKLNEYSVTAKVKGTYLGSRTFEYETQDNITTEGLKTGFVFELSPVTGVIMAAVVIVMILTVSVIVKSVKKKKR